MMVLAVILTDPPDPPELPDPPAASAVIVPLMVAVPVTESRIRPPPEIIEPPDPNK
jgi:hypothetical protein